MSLSRLNRFVPRLVPLEDRQTPTIIPVTGLSDSGAGSLREAIAVANIASDEDVIVFAPEVRGGTINLSTFTNFAASTAAVPQPAGPSALLVTNPVTIQGTGETLNRDSTSAFRLFQVTATGRLVLQNLTLSGGLVQGGSSAAGFGGAIYNQGTLTVLGCTLTGNRAIGGEGGSFGGGGLGGSADTNGNGGGPNGGAAGKSDTGNAGGDGDFGGGGGRGARGAPGGGAGGRGGAGGFGGGGGGGGFGSQVNQTLGTGGAGGAGGFGGGGGHGTEEGMFGISGPPGPGGFGGGSGGGINSSGGGAGMGGAIFNQGGTVNLVNCTLAGNAAVGGNSPNAGGGSGFGGGLLNLNGSLTLTNCTIAENTITAGVGATEELNGRADGGALYNISIKVGGVTPTLTASVTLANCILAVTPTPPVGIVALTNVQVDGTASITVPAPNIVFPGFGNSGALTGIPFLTGNPKLDPLGNNGGPTRTMIVQPGSRAIDAGDSAVIPSDATTDQRGSGFVRISNGKVDIGAFEVQVPVVVAPVTLPAGQVGVAFNQTITAAGPPAPFTFIVTSGALPDGLSLSGDGTLGGTPTTAGVFDFTVMATNTTAESGGLTYTLTVASASPPPPPPAPRSVLVGGPPDGTARVLTSSAGSLTPDRTLTVFPGLAVNARPATADVNGDGVPDVIVGAGPGGSTQVRVFDGRTDAPIASWQPFEAAFTGGVFVAAADIDGDGLADVIVCPDRGGGPVVAAYSGARLTAGLAGDAAQLARFFGIEDPAFRGGARPALGDLTGDGTADLVVSAGILGGPRIAVFDGATVAAGHPAHLVGDFFAFEDGLRNGAFVAAGDVTGDGFAELAFGGGPGGAPRVRLFDGKGLVAAGGFATLDAVAAAQRANFFAGDAALRGGVRLALADADGDGRSDLVTGSGEGDASRVRVYTAPTLLGAASPAADQDLDPFAGAVLADGVFVG
jgi:hypothetical protein